MNPRERGAGVYRHVGDELGRYCGTIYLEEVEGLCGWLE